MQSHAQCGTADPNKPDPPQGTAAFASLDAVGVRIWPCNKGAIDATKVDATANFTGTSYSGTWNGQTWSGDAQPNGWTGNFVYVNGIAQFTLVRTSTGKTYLFHLDAKPVLDSTTPAGQLAPARWGLTWDGPAPAGVDANATAFLIRKSITGGAAPAACANKTDTVVNVPYTATCKYLENNREFYFMSTLSLFI